MSPRIIRIKKEARALFWPWCAVAGAGALPIFLPHQFGEVTSVLSLFWGIPLLAALSLGHEFQHGTLQLWLAQPATRMQLWSEKMMVMSVAVLSAGAICGAGIFGFTWRGVDFTYELAALCYIIIIVASATFWTLAARSVIGGAVLIVCSQYLILLGFAEAFRLPLPGEALRPVSPAGAIMTAIAVFTAGYGALMLVLGARKLLRFQARGSAAGDLLTAGHPVMPRALAGWFRCRPYGALGNLIRKELRLLRPLWLMELLVIVYLAFVGILRLLPAPRGAMPLSTPEWTLIALPVSLCIGMAGLAGVLSLGEERASGTQGWHVTLPVSASRQWLIKLGAAMLGGAGCAVLLPLLTLMAAGSIYGTAFQYVDLRALPDQLLILGILTFACFWCACATTGTVRAMTWLFPVIVVNYLAGAGGFWLGQELARITGTVKDLVVSWFHLNLSPAPFALWSPSPGLILGNVSLAFAPALVFGVMQSRRLFREQPSHSPRWILRRLLPPCTVSFFWCLILAAGVVSSSWRPLEETRQALDRLQPREIQSNLAGDDLARSSPLTSTTRRWLKGASIHVASDPFHPAGYVATIHLAGGQECKLTVVNPGSAVWCGR
jgi:hypothetical protein